MRNPPDTAHALRLLVIGLAAGIAASVWIVRSGGPSERLTAAWAFGFYALICGVVVVEIIIRLIRRREK